MMHSWQLYALEAFFRNPFKNLVNLERDVKYIRHLFDKSRAYLKPLRTVDSARVPFESFSAEWFNPVSPRDDVIILYLHGGGYCLGSTDSHRSYLSYFCSLVNAPVLAPNYRLAPEHPFPAALEDSLATYLWLLENKNSRQRIILAGESAGGGLCLSTLLKIKQENLPLPLCSVCISPWVDLTHSGPSIIYNRVKDVMLKGEHIRQAARLYCQKYDADFPLISPLFGDLTGLPPLMIQASSSEALLSDALRLRSKAHHQGVSVHLDLWQGMPHAWPYFASFLPEAKAALNHIKDFIDAQLLSPGTLNQNVQPRHSSDLSASQSSAA